VETARIEGARQLEEAERARAQLEDVLDSMSDAFYAYDHDFRLVRANRAARDIMRDTGIDPASAIGALAWDIFPRIEQSPIGRALRRCGAERVPVTVEDFGPYSGRWLEMQFYPTSDGVAVYVHDTTERKRGELVQRLFAEAGAILSSALDRESALTAVARLVVPAIADWFVLHIFDETGRLAPVVTLHADASKQSIAARYNEKYPADAPDARGPAVVARTGRAELYTTITDEMLRAAARDAEHLDLIRGLGMTSLILVPLIARERHYGAMSLIAAESRRRYDEGDLRVAEEFARRIALALDNLELFRAARTAADRTQRLQSATSAFAGALTADDVARVMLTQGLAALHATAGVVYLVGPSGDVLEAAAWEGIQEEAFAAWFNVPFDSPMLVSDAIRAGKPLYSPSREQTLEQYPSAREANRLVVQDSWAAIPLMHAGRPLGCLALGFDRVREFSAEDRALIDAVAQQCAQALERARLFQAERRARSTAERLQALTAALSEATSLTGVADVVMQYGVTALGAYAGVVALPTNAGTELELLSSVGYPAEACMSIGKRWPLVADIPICEASRTGEPVFIESPEIWGARYLGGYAPKNSTSAAWAAIPLRKPGSPQGALLWTYDRPHTFSDDERSLMTAIARQCSQALDRARLFEAERAARGRADEANRAKTDFLAVMSHELRTPLNAIAGYAELLELGVHGALTAAQREAVERIQRSQRHLLGLINDVLNFARIDAGHLELEMGAVQVDPALESLEGLVAPLIDKKQLRYEYGGSDPSLFVLADAEKLRQVMLNLLSNAVKFTEPGGRIAVSCSTTPEGVAISVTDSGPGIPPDKLERIFEPFVQLDVGRTRTHEGTGLGLAISRDLARWMRGDLTVESRLGEGSTFTLTLPRA
jgi:signal transduction histidine kinase